ncbi:tail fiber domain-containing protein [Streptococcus mitis]|uniref:tail fiber domain-containing protein n=1 Tax=Streptococcus mitis TaxID=28037 RepID=UPI0039C12FF0
MDALTRRQFDRAMLAKERTLAIRVGDYASRDIKEASFEYGYIKGDTYKPGGTCAGSGKITFTSIITTFNKLDILHPEIGLLVGDAYQWVKMGEYFINDIEIDRNRNTTTLELMDGMFKLNREYVTDLHFPAEVREVIQEICLKTGIELANDYFGISAMRYHVEQVPEGKKLSFRDMLSAMTQMIGMSCFFNREGKMEIRDLAESNITINADSYFLHGLTKSEIEYQIAGITCKTDKKSLTVGMKTGRSLELDNVFMTQSALNDLYYKLKNLTYYPYNLNYQGHLLLEVGQWVTIQTNKKETFKVPVLSQSFTFKGGLRGRISADSKSGNDTQYSYEGTITKQIKQQDGIEAKIQAQIEAADAAFDAEFKKRKKEIDDGIELAKAKAEEVKQELSDTINQRFDSFDNGPLKEAKRKAEEALKNAGASSSLAQEAKQIGLDSVARLEAFKSQTTTTQTALSGDLDALKRTIANDIRPKQAQAEAEIAKQVEALIQTKNELAGVKSAQATYEETTTRRLAELINLANGKASKSELTQTAEELASKIASVKVGGRNYYRDSEKIRTSTRFFSFPLHSYLSQENVGETWTLSFDIKINEGGEIRPLHFYHYQNNRFGLKASADITPSREWQRFTFTGPVIFPNDDPRYARGEMALYDYGGNNNYSVRRIKLEKGNVATDWIPAIEDTDGKISAVESNFRQRADALDAGVRSLTEGLRTKADISSLNVTAENIRQTVKRLETDTQNKLDQKLNLAEFEVQAGSIRQEILNATKDKADKTLVVAEAGKLREEFSNLRVGGRNYYRDSEKVRTSTRFFSFPLHSYLSQENVGETWTLSFDIKINEGGEIRPLHFYHYQNNRFGLKASADITPSREWQRFTFTGPVIFPNDDPRYARGEMALYDYGGNNNYSVRRIKLEKGNVATDWSPAVEDTDGLITEAKATFERTAQGLRTDLSAIQEYVNKDGQRQDVLQRYAREESAKQATAVRELVAKDYVGKTTYQEDVKGINQKIEAVKTSANKEIASQIASYRQSVDGKFTDISSQITTYKQDVGGQISGLSNRLTSSEQGTTTQISNLSNRINSNKQGTDNQISSLKTQVATNKDNAERQMGRISDQVSANKANADSQFANVTNQLARKVETTDFQRVKETSQIYERILGNSENGIADKVARMAMTNQLFQVEVSKNEGLKTVQRQLAGSWAVQNINSAGDLISGINLGANGHNRFVGKLTHITGETLIDNAVIKSAMVDKLKTANFETGSVTTTILDAEAVTADKVRFDNAFIRKMLANEAFIDQLTSKQIFATKVESVVSSSTFLEAYQGRIGGFTLGQFDQGGGRWISGVNQFSVGMGNGAGYGVRTAFWANWGNNWNYAGPKAWNVNTDGKMYCRNEVGFYDQVDFSNSSRANFYGNTTFSRSPVFSNGIELGEKDVFGDGWNPKGGRNAVVWWNQVGSGSVKYWMDQKSDRRLKENITDTAVKALDKINRLRMVAFDFIESKKHEEIGLIAQEAETIVPRIVSRNPENPDGYLHIDYTALVPYLIKAIQELNQKIEKMEKIIA